MAPPRPTSPVPSAPTAPSNSHEARQAILLDITRAILEEDRDESALSLLVFEHVSEHLGVNLCFSYALDADRGTLRLLAGPGIPSEFLTAAQELHLGEAFCGTAAQTRASFVADAERILNDGRGGFVRAMGVRAYACHPLLGRGGELLGTLSFASTRRDRFSSDEIGFLQAVCDFVAIAWQRHRAERALRDSEARFRTAADSSPALMWMTDDRGTIVFANRRYRAFFHVESDAMLGEGWRTIVQPEDGEAFHEAFRLAFAAREPFHQLVRVHHPTLGVRWLSCDGNPRYGLDGKFLGYTGVNVDVTEATHAQAALREAESRSRILFEAAPFSVIVIDPATHEILDVNDYACAEYGYSREEFLQRKIGDIDALGDSEVIRKRGRAHTLRPGTQEFEAKHRRKSGETRDVLVRVHGVRLGGRDISYGAHFDITERKAAEERQHLLARELDHRAKNILAVVQAALRLTPRDDPEAYVRAVEGRLGALARAHSMLAETRWERVELRGLLEGELAPFLAAQRVELNGPVVFLPARAAQPFAMAVHELATNATKHGALSVPAGRISVAWQFSGAAQHMLRLRWLEANGPHVLGSPKRRGFGSRVLEATIRMQLGGTVSASWEPTGLICDVEMPIGPVPEGLGEGVPR